MSPDELADESRWQICSLALALGAAIAGAMGFGRSMNFFLVSFVLSTVWLALFVVGLFTLGWRGLWLLVGFPFAMLWPVVIVLLLGFGAEIVP